MKASPPQGRLPGRVLFAFACVYFFWGSTYLAIRVAGMHIAPPLVAACRSLLSTTLMILICLVRGVSLRVSKRDAWRLVLVGVLLMTCNNILLTWAETMVPSGLASLVVATMPIMIALIEAALPGGEGLNKRGWAGTLIGTAGMVALVWPSLRRGPAPAGDRQLLGFCILLVAALAFAVGSILSRRFRFKLDPFVATTWQIGAAGLANLSIAAAGGTFRTAVWTRHGVLAIVYLSIFGSLVGLSAYTYLLQHVPVTKVSTYAFVNPMIAVVLGVVLLGERLQSSEILGMAAIVGAVAMVVLSRVKRNPGGGPPIEDATEEASEEGSQAEPGATAARG
jgi:drug/metabolite transporter (DMT)-like permease